MHYLYSYDTTAKQAAELSAEREEIVHVQCSDRDAYAAELSELLDSCDEFGGGEAELEIIGELGDQWVRVHLSSATSHASPCG